MIHYIAHRVNSLSELRDLSTDYGAEIDIRPYADQLIVHHDPYAQGELLENYLANYQHGTLILNIKAEAIEYRILELLKHYNIDNYFFLDCSFPMIYKLMRQGERRIALRFSEFEGLDTVRAMAGSIEWIWVDCFSRLPLNRAIYEELKQLGYKLCLVSPELQGQAEKLLEYKKFLASENIVFDAICTKLQNVSRWFESS